MEHVRRLVYWFAAGVVFALGVMTVVVAWDYAKVLRHESDLVMAPPDLVVTGSEPLTINTSAGVRATLVNRSSSVAYSPSTFELRIEHQGKLLSTCSPSGDRPQLEPGRTKTVQLTCSDILRSAVPSDAAYKLVIQTAWRFKEERKADAAAASQSR